MAEKMEYTLSLANLLALERKKTRNVIDLPFLVVTQTWLVFLVKIDGYSTFLNENVLY